jgi:hypothetical protein
MNGGFVESHARPCATPNVLFRLVFVRKPPFRFRPSPVVRGAHLEGPLVALFGHRAMSGLSPQCASKRTSADQSEGSRPGQHRPRGNLIRPTTGRSRMGVMRKLPVVPICRNPSALPLPPNQRQISRRPALNERGVSRSSRTLRRDAVDAEVLSTNSANADGKVVWS